MKTAERADPPRRTILAIAPYRRDAEVLDAMLGEIGLRARGAVNAAEVAAGLSLEPHAILISQHGLDEATIAPLARWLEDQPKWSEMPVIFLLGRDGPAPSLSVHLERMLPRAKLTILQRPLRMVELASAIMAAVVARERQIQIRDYLNWQEELRRELNHRVKNILANVTALFHMTRIQSADLNDFCERFGGRLQALDRVHSGIVVPGRSGDLRGASELVLAPYGLGRGERVRIDGPFVPLRAPTASTIALCLHELATNAAKYGSLSAEGGRVELEWWRMPDGRVALEWREIDGPAPPEHQPPSGYGHKFIRSAARGLPDGASELALSPAGLRWTLAFRPDGGTGAQADAGAAAGSGGGRRQE